MIQVPFYKTGDSQAYKVIVKQILEDFEHCQKFECFLEIINCIIPSVSVWFYNYLYTIIAFINIYSFYVFIWGAFGLFCLIFLFF